MRLAVIGILLCGLFSFSQAEQEPPSYIKTIIFNTESSPDSFPIVSQGQPIRLQFDDLNANEADYYYEIEHCNYDWTPSPIAKINYMDGYDNQRIMNYRNAMNMLQSYSSYTLDIPNQFTKGLKYTGNYLLKIKKDGEVVFTRRFVVVSDEILVAAKVKRTREISEIDKKQVLQFEARNVGSLYNLQQFIKVAVMKNAQWTTLKTDLQPQFILGDRITYSGNNEIAFLGGNEFLQFDNKTIRGGNVYIRSIQLKDLYHNYLYTDEERKRKTYTYFPDINGGFVVRNLDVAGDESNADYVWVHFELKVEDTEETDEVYVVGRFNNYNLSEENRLLYDEEHHIYHGKILIKQGFCNYDYAVKHQDGTVDYNAISGNFWQTENNYQILVYYHDFNQNYDRAVGRAAVSSLNIEN